METADVKIKGERNRSPRVNSGIGTLAVCVVITVACTALFVCLRWSASRIPPVALCSGAACEAYARLLGDITNRSVSPCHDFHDFVCTRRRSGQPRSGREHAVRAFRKHAVAAAEALVRTGDAASPAALAAAQFYKSCEDIIVGKKVETEQLRTLLADVGSEWPNLDRNPDLLNLVVRLSAQARWDMPLQVIVDVDEDGATVVQISPSKNFETVMKIRARLAQLQRYESHYNLLRDSLLPKGTESLSFDGLLEIEKSAVSSLKISYLASPSKHSVEVDLSNVSTVTPFLPTDHWNRTLSAAFGELSPGTRLRIENLAFLKALFALNGKIGERYSSWFISWCAVMLISSMTNADAITNAHSSFDEALEAHRNSCFDMAHSGFGYAFYAPHVEDLVNPNVRMDVAQMNSRVRSAMGLIATGWVQQDRLTPFLASDPQKLLEEVFRSSPLRLQAAFASYPKMTGSITVDWRLAMEGLDSSIGGDVRPRVAPHDWEDLLVATEGSYQVTLMPHAMEIPLYHVDAPLSLKYAGLGFQVAVALSSMLFSDGAFGTASPRPPLQMSAVYRRAVMQSEPCASSATAQASQIAANMLHTSDEDVRLERPPDGHQDCWKDHTMQLKDDVGGGASNGAAGQSQPCFETTDEGFMPSKEMAPISQFRLSNVPREFTTGDPALSATKSQLTFTVPQHPLETQKIRSRSPVVAICIPVVVSAIAIGALVALYVYKPVRVRILAKCRSQACSQYDAIVTDLLDNTVAPCEDFYSHVCGAWSSDPTKLSVSKAALSEYRQSLSRLILTLPVPSSGQSSHEKAVKLFTACLNILEKNISYVESIRRVMESAGIPWPHIDSKTDLLYSVFTMASWPISVPFRITCVGGVNETAHLVIASVTLDVFSNHIWKKKDEGRRERYFSVMKKYFESTKYSKGIAYNETLSLEQRIVPLLQMSLVKKMEVARIHSTELHMMTPSVPTTAWQREIRARFNVSSASVTIYGIDFFKAFFELHRTLGEDAMKLYFGWFVIESFVPYTNSHTLHEFHGSPEKAREEQTNTCLQLANVAGFALEVNYGNSAPVAKMFDRAAQVGERIKVAFYDTVKRNSWFEENLASTLEIGHAVGLFDLLGKSGEEEMIPDMTDDVLENMVALTSLRPRCITSNTSDSAPFSSAMRTVNHSPDDDSHVASYTTNRTLALEPYHFAFPFLAEDAPMPAVYAGVGFVLARLLFHHLFGGRQQWQSATIDELTERTWCMNSDDEAALMDRATREDVVASTAAVSTLWRAFTMAAAPASNITLAANGPDSQLPTLEDRRLFFLLLCHSKCGDQAGKLLCNLPLRNSEAFVETFSCQAGSPMHATRMCPVFV
ncbi:hypothetical protein V5799_019084 [Amblyomma americanum]|uniref:Peptidase M13 N-terminal domain-containing protein n=1 Tax=Amblyomma americanum TaxID=6943 RepID=A0AAQ4EXI9_AMBAM